VVRKKVQMESALLRMLVFGLVLLVLSTASAVEDDFWCPC